MSPPSLASGVESKSPVSAAAGADPSSVAHGSRDVDGRPMARSSRFRAEPYSELDGYRSTRIGGCSGLGNLGMAAVAILKAAERASMTTRSILRSALGHLTPHPAHPVPSAPGDENSRQRRSRRLVTWRSALGTGLVCFGIWLVLDAPALMRSARAAPLGARRTVAIDLLRPIDDLTTAVGLSHVVGAADRVMGRTGNSVVKVLGQPLRRPSSSGTNGHGAHARGSHHSEGDRAGSTAAGPAKTAGGLLPLRAPSTSDPLRVLSVGDSLGVDFGQTFVDDLASTGVVTAVLDARVDTGLSRPDYFDWQQELESDLARFHPQVVVVFLGANDPQNFVEAGSALSFGTPAWDAAYALRVDAFVKAATASGARVLWVGMPPMSDPGLTEKMQVLNEIYERQTALYWGASYFPSWPVLSGPGGEFAAYLPDASGSEVQVREPDGTHISPGGAERLSQATIADMDHEWDLGLQP